MELFPKMQPDFTPTPTLLQIGWDVVCPKAFSNNGPNNSGHRTLKKQM
jgi:hypothetical protein